MNLLKTDNFDTLHDFSLSVSYISDSILVFSKVKDFIYQNLQCDEILLFLDDRNRSCLTAPHPYNPNRNIEDINIPYKDSLVKNILIDRKFFTRLDSDEPLFKEFKSELFVPLISPEDTLGFIYIARQKATRFTINEIKLVEFTTSYLTNAIERSLWEERLVKSHNLLQGWQDKYLSIIDALPFPAAIVDLSDNSINEVNDKFVKLTGRDFQTIYNESAEDVFKVDGVENLLSVESNRQYKILFVRQNGENEYAEGIFSPVEGQSNHVKLLSLLSSPKTQLNENWNQSLFDFIKSVQPEKSLTEIFQAAIPLLSQIFNSGYFTIHSLTRDKRLLLEAAYLFKGDYSTRPDDNVLAGINEGPFRKTIETGRPQFISDINTDANYAEWRPIAKRVGYRAFATLPFDIGEQGTAILSFFPSESFQWGNGIRHWLQNFCQTTSQIITKHNLLSELQKKSEQIEIIGKLTKEINSKLDFQSVIKTAALEMRKVIPFDYFSIILFDEDGKDNQVYDLAVEPIMKKLGSEWDWQQLENTNLGWVKPLAESYRLEDSDDVKPQRMPFSLPSHTSVLLLSDANYLGNCALGRMEQRAFVQRELQFLRQVAGQIATAIKNSRLYGQTKSRLNEISTLAQVSRSISETLDINAILNITADAAEQSLFSKECSVIPVDEKTTIQDLFFWMPDSVQALFSNDDLFKIINHFEEEKQLILFDSPQKLLDDFEITDIDKSQLDSFRPFIIAPVLRDSNLLAVLVAITNGDPGIHEHDMEIATTLINQAQNAISKADLFQKSIRNADELESFVYAVSHELKTPILTVQSFASLLKEEYSKILPVNAAKYLDRIIINLSKMQNLVMDLLDLSRIGRDGIKLEQCGSSEMVNSAIESVDGLLHEYPTQITVQKDLPEIYAHASLITQVFTNLISNGIKYSKSKPNAALEIGSKETRNNFEFFVRDNGAGIPEELQDRIFDLFHTRNDSDDDLSTGVGLTIVRKIIELHKGAVWVESKVGQGSTFKFTLPKKVSAS